MKRTWLMAVLLLMPLVACYRDNYGPMRGWDHMMYGYGYMHGGMFMWLLFIVIICAIVYLVIQQTKSKTGKPSEPTPLNILKSRYAKGEITKEEYDRMKNDLLD